MPSLRFRRSQRIGLQRDFDRLFQHGRRQVWGPWVLLYEPPLVTGPSYGPGAGSGAGALATELQSAAQLKAAPLKAMRVRLGIKVARVAGNAVERNRIKRWIRETFRHNQARIQPGAQLLFWLRRKEPNATYATVQEVFALLLGKAKLYL